VQLLKTSIRVFLCNKTQQKMYRESFYRNFSCSQYNFIPEASGEKLLELTKIIIKNELHPTG
jgi:hypothetical protein